MTHLMTRDYIMGIRAEAVANKDETKVHLCDEVIRLWDENKTLQELSTSRLSAIRSLKSALEHREKTDGKGGVFDLLSRVLLEKNAASDITAQGVVLLLGVAIEAQTAGQGIGDLVKIRPMKLSHHMGISAQATMRKARDLCIEHGWLEYNLESPKAMGEYRLKIP